MLVCYGDSNTFGYDPRGYFGGRYDHPWPELLAELTGYLVRNNGMNGREIPGREVAFPKNADKILVMLGTNDLLQGKTSPEAAARMEAFLRTIPREKALLIAPPPMRSGEWVPDQSLIDASRELALLYRELAQKMGIDFADGAAWNIPICFDGVHFTEEGHRRFAEELYQLLRCIL